MASPALPVFTRLQDQITTIQRVAERETAAGHGSEAALYRSCIVLMVAAFDTYMHEQGVRILRMFAGTGAAAAAQVISYLGAITPTHLSTPHAEGLIRLRLSYKTLVAPDKIDELLAAGDVDADDAWLRASIALGQRPDRLRRQVQLQYDRRNQIAHEGDWDPAALDIRPIQRTHVDDCAKCLGDLVQQFDVILP
jgi:hypothetical protein